MKALLLIVIASLGVVVTSCSQTYSPTKFESEFGTSVKKMVRAIRPVEAKMSKNYPGYLIHCASVKEIDDGWVLEYIVRKDGSAIDLVVYYMDSQDGDISVEEE
tara:strand:- start:1154 stop:1465 length:312 start_codon:yes stop_codon:yes gene_type:complete